MTTWRSNGLLGVPYRFAACQTVSDGMGACCGKHSLVALTDPRLVLTTPKDGVIGLPDQLTGVNATSGKLIRFRDGKRSTKHARTGMVELRALGSTGSPPRGRSATVPNWTSLPTSDRQ